MPIDLPDQISTTWFKANMPFKDKQFDRLKDLVEQLESGVDGLNKDGIELGATSTMVGLTKQLQAEARKLEGAKGLSKDHVKKLVQYGNAGKLLAAALGKALEGQKTAAELAGKNQEEIAQFKIAIDRADKLIEKLYEPVRALMTDCETAKTPTVLAAKKKLLQAGYKGCAALIDPGAGGWEKRWQGLMRVATPANKKQFEDFGIRTARAIKVRDTLVKGYNQAMAVDLEVAPQ